MNKQKWRLSDFKDWNMYKNYLFEHGNLKPELNFKPVDWRKYLKSSGKFIDLPQKTQKPPNIHTQNSLALRNQGA